MKNPEITVLMSIYNGVKYLNQAIDSILNQTFRDFEFLIINDGSTDKTSEILQSYKDHRIKIINNEKNIGLTKSLNKGLKIARGEYIARMDADDISYPSRLEIQYNYLESNKEVGIVCSWNDVIDENGKAVEIWRRVYSDEYIYFILHFRNCLTHSSIMFKKELLNNLGNYNEKIVNCQDYELWNRVSKVIKIHQIPILLVKWRKTNNSISSKKKSNQIETVSNIVKNNLECLIENKIEDKMIRFIHGNYENPNYCCLSDFNENELLYSIKLLSKINKVIVNETPNSLNETNIKKIVTNKLTNYIYMLNDKINIFKLLQSVNEYIDKNAVGRMKIMILIIYKRLRYYIRALLKND